jgi:hypothetical protein
MSVANKLAPLELRRALVVGKLTRKPAWQSGKERVLADGDQLTSTACQSLCLALEGNRSMRSLPEKEIGYWSILDRRVMPP